MLFPRKIRNPQILPPNVCCARNKKKLPQRRKSRWPPGKNTILYTIDIRLYVSATHLYLYMEIYIFLLELLLRGEQSDEEIKV